MKIQGFGRLRDSTQCNNGTASELFSPSSRLMKEDLAAGLPSHRGWHTRRLLRDVCDVTTRFLRSALSKITCSRHSRDGGNPMVRKWTPAFSGATARAGVSYPWVGSGPMKHSGQALRLWALQARSGDLQHPGFVVPGSQTSRQNPSGCLRHPASHRCFSAAGIPECKPGGIRLYFEGWACSFT